MSNNKETDMSDKKEALRLAREVVAVEEHGAPSAVLARALLAADAERVEAMRLATAKAEIERRVVKVYESAAADMATVADAYEKLSGELQDKLDAAGQRAAGTDRGSLFERYDSVVRVVMYANAWLGNEHREPDFEADPEERASAFAHWVMRMAPVYVAARAWRWVVDDYEGERLRSLCAAVDAADPSPE